jgi:hypothetical protein
VLYETLFVHVQHAFALQAAQGQSRVAWFAGWLLRRRLINTYGDERFIGIFVS